MDQTSTDEDQMTANHVSFTTTSRRSLWAGRILTAIPSLFLAFDAVVHLLQPQFAVQATIKMGYPASMLPVLGALQIAFLIAYLVPRTAILGAVLWTGYLGGAVATHVRAGDPLLTHVIVPVYVAAFLWAGLYLRDPRLRFALSHR
jgi:hypothetical protein